MRTGLLAWLLCAAGAIVPVSAQLTPSQEWAATAQARYMVRDNVTYSVVDGHENKLDVYIRRDLNNAPQPTLLYIHGGGWTSGSKQASEMSIVPWLEMGWVVVNVDYRLAGDALAPAAVDDCLCALRWMGANAQRYGIDVNHIVVSGDSAGAHLALVTGMMPESAGFGKECPQPAARGRRGGPAPITGPFPKAEAIVDWYGIADVPDILGEHRQGYAVQWFGNIAKQEEIARLVSPMTYVRAGLPPIFIIHGNADPTVPYEQSVKLAAALTKAGVPNQLSTVEGGGHGGFNAPQRVKIWNELRAFLAANKVIH